MIAEETLDTLPKYLKRNFERYGAKKAAMRKKDFGLWIEYSWKDCYEAVKYFSLGLRCWWLGGG